MKTIVTHSGSFHADDVFSIAAFQLLLGKENINVIRTRDEAIIAEADYVVDVGGVYDHEAKLYDHHQVGAPVRDNGIPYAGFGLVWKHYGEEICGSAEIVQYIEEVVCQPIDAGDNGVTLYNLNEYGVRPFELYSIVSLFTPSWGSMELKDEQFIKAVDWARSIIERMIEKGVASEKQKALVAKTYDATTEKQILLFDESVSVNALLEYDDVNVVVCPDDDRESGEKWTATCVRKDFNTFETRVSFPENWAGLRNEELAEVSGLADAVFCHKARFIFVAGSKESALAAAKLAS